MNVAGHMGIAAENNLLAANVAVYAAIDMGMIGEDIPVDMTGMANDERGAMQIALNLTENFQLARARYRARNANSGIDDRFRGRFHFLIQFGHPLQPLATSPPAYAPRDPWELPLGSRQAVHLNALQTSAYPPTQDPKPAAAHGWTGIHRGASPLELQRAMHGNNWKIIASMRPVDVQMRRSVLQRKGCRTRFPPLRQSSIKAALQTRISAQDSRTMDK